MSRVNTDFAVPPGSTINNVAIGVYLLTADAKHTHMAEQNISPALGVVSNFSDNQAGVFGWVTFGKNWGGKIFFEERQAINYINQQFFPKSFDQTHVRIWLRPGVNANVSIAPVATFLKILNKVAADVIPFIRVGAEKAVGTKKQLPAKVP